MKVTNLEVLRCDAGWRNYHFLKLTTDDGIVGWSEFDEGFGSPGVAAVIERLADRVVGQPVFDHERIYVELYCVTRPAAGGVVGEGLGAIENALLDAKAKALEVPCYVLLGGKVRDRIRVYWSHCATWRINHPAFFTPAITSLDGVRAIGAEVREKGFTALKTNIFLYENGRRHAWRPGFGVPFFPELNVDKNVLRNLRAHLSAIREGAGPDIDLLLDLNFNAKTEGYLKILKAIADFDMFWVEIDTYSPEALGYLRRQSPHPISSCETLLGLREFLALFPRAGDRCGYHRRGMERCVASNEDRSCRRGMRGQHRPHNFYGHLATMMNAHFAAATQNLRVMEIDIDRLAWDHEVFTVSPQFEDGHLILPDTPGWGTEPNEAAVRAHPPKPGGGLLRGRSS
jgi:galactonate dehydratase